MWTLRREDGAKGSRNALQKPPFSSRPFLRGVGLPPAAPMGRLHPPEVASRVRTFISREGGALAKQQAGDQREAPPHQAFQPWSMTGLVLVRNAHAGRSPEELALGLLARWC